MTKQILLLLVKARTSSRSLVKQTLKKTQGEGQNGSTKSKIEYLYSFLFWIHKLVTVLCIMYPIVYFGIWWQTGWKVKNILNSNYCKISFLTFLRWLMRWVLHILQFITLFKHESSANPFFNFFTDYLSGFEFHPLCNIH